MKERPILFSAPMVRAILDGRKTQTRRIIKPQPPKPVMAEVGVSRDPGSPSGWSFICDQFDDMPLTCSHGQPGDRLWVRETWALGEWFGDHWEPAVPSVNAQAYVQALYRASADLSLDDMKEFRWRPSIHMPRRASRIDLEIEAVRVERLQDITEDDAKAEGVEAGEDRRWVHEMCALPYQPCRSKFIDLWDSLTDTHTWIFNPWVWVIQFRRVKP